LGKIKHGETTVDFTFTNTGDTLVSIKKIGVSCGCTAVSWSMGPITPMEKGEVRGTYTPQAPGEFRKRLVVFSDAVVNKLPLYIEGVVQSKAEPISEGG